MLPNYIARFMHMTYRFVLRSVVRSSYLLKKSFMCGVAEYH